MNEQFDWLAGAPQGVSHEVVEALSEPERAEFRYYWQFYARASQLAPPGDWRVWLILAGRGFGKTRAGAEWVRAVAESEPTARIALVAASLAEARAIMVEGESGIMACCPPERRPTFEASNRRLRFPNGAHAQLFSAAEPELLRGPQHSHSWCDEIGKWPQSADRATRCWDNLMLGLRLGERPQIAATTTPRCVPLISRLVGDEVLGSTVVTRGSTHDNAANLPVRFLDAIQQEYGETQQGRQEIEGELLADVEGALWTRSMLERCRTSGENYNATRIVVAVDPPASAHGDACGIVVAALLEDSSARVLADCSVEKARPELWAQKVAGAALQWQADRVIAEGNQGGSMVESVLRATNSQLPVKLVHASRGKAARSEPVAALYEAGRVKHDGHFPQLEDQMCGLLIGGEYVGPGRSPDRADALVWALTELMLGRAKRPRVLPI